MKALLERCLDGLGVLIFRVGLAPLLIRLNRRSPRVLMYHACEENETDFTRGLHVNTTPAQFAEHIAFLSRHYQIVPLSDLLEGARARRAQVAITFDDGFRSVYEHAWPLLRERGAAATCYLTTGVVGNRGLIWLNELNWFLHRHGDACRPRVAARLALPEDASISELTSALVKQFDAGLVAELLASFRARHQLNPAAMAREHQVHLDWDEVAEMASAGISFGNHTVSHPALAGLSNDACREEIAKAMPGLEHLPGAGTTLAYPFGSQSPLVRSVALGLGVQSLLEVEGVNFPFDPTRIGRIKVSAFSASVLFARMEVVEPIKALLKRGLRRFRPGS